MKTFSQINPQWKGSSLGDSSLTIGGYGCFLCSIAMLGQIDPLTLNHLGIEKGGYTNHGLLISSVMAKIAGMKVVSNGELTQDEPLSDTPCIAITDHYKSRGIPTHFFVYLPDGKIIDPLDLEPEPKPNNYRIIGYRHFNNVSLNYNNPSDQKEIPEWATKYINKMNKKGITTSPDAKVGDLPLYQLIGIVDKYVS